jgi:cytochrome c
MMQRLTQKRLFLTFKLAAFLIIPSILMGCHEDSPKLTSDLKQNFYLQHVGPVLKENCYRCHAGMNRKGGFRMDSRGALLAGGKDGVVVVPGDAEKSRMLHVVRREGSWGKPMPPDGPLTEGEIVAIEQWIRDGAVMPEAERR